MTHADYGFSTTICFTYLASYCRFSSILCADGCTAAASWQHWTRACTYLPDNHSSVASLSRGCMVVPTALSLSWLRMAVGLAARARPGCGYWLAGLLLRVGVFGRRRLGTPPAAVPLPCLPTVGSSAFLPGCTLSCPPFCSGAPNLMGYPGCLPLMLPSFLGCCLFLITH